jgi:hypothetical protein
VIRIARPFATEEKLFEKELETLTRTSITLLGAQPRPHGLVLRFEVLLTGGQVLMRGEGRVVGYKPDAYYGLGGLTLRFTRLDTRSKAVVDRAAALRERRRPSSAGGLAATPALSAPPVPVADPGPPPLARAPASEVLSALPPLPTAVMTPRDDPPATKLPGDRDALLERLRARSKALNDDVLQQILERRR